MAERESLKYKKISDELRVKVGKYTAEQGNTAAMRKFSQEFESPLSESSWTVEKEGGKQVEIGGLNDKGKSQLCLQPQSLENFSGCNLCIREKQISAIPESAFQRIGTLRTLPTTWSNETTMIDYITKIIIPFTEKKRRELHLYTK